MHPLPRSLEPASGESLVSYLLRLGHRLSLRPLQLIRAAGWTDRVQATHIPGSLLLNLTGPEAQGFARLTRQTAEEVSALTLKQWRDRYPPIALSVPGPGPKRPDPWLFVGSPRYCPTCLAGDCTPAQQLHGGPWRKLWHLPIVFSCVEHQTYLEASCPHCGQPRAISGRLIERANDHTLHPAQCRWTIDSPTQKRKSRACGGRLDQRVATDPCHRPHPTQGILRFQQSLLARLEPLTPASDASEYFTDLRLATALIGTTWPAGKHLLDTALAGHVTAYVHSTSGNSSTSNRLQDHRLRDVLPRDSIACAGLLRAAHSLLKADDLSEHLSQLVHTLESGRHARPGYASTPAMKTRARGDSETRPNH
ncbi:TniQ family protein [Streptomyces sp. f51]|uniref:TniQ family protein n=1 Tax=Streptomyces sp. f51 TaxID=1827742 RepID=UPI00211D70FF|nr:TniQ family protein [Streptomyces sp. f51]